MAQFTVANNTTEALRVAVYQKPILRPNLGIVAWRIIEPPPMGITTITVPSDYQIYANYSRNPLERNNPNAGNRTNVRPFADYTSSFVVRSVSGQDPQANAATIEQTFDDLTVNEVHVKNSFNYGVWCHVIKDGDDVYAPQVIWPGGVLMEDIRASFYLAVVAQFVSKGDRLVDEEISLTETEVLEGGTAIVTGSMWEGYAISLGSGALRAAA